MTVSHLIIAVLVGKFSGDWPAHRTAGWVGVAFVSLVENSKVENFVSDGHVAAILHA